MDENYSKPPAVYIPQKFCAIFRDSEIDDDDEEKKNQICDLIGISRDHTLASALEFLFAGVFRLEPEHENRVNFILAVLDSLKPKNIAESMLVVQMCLCHESSLKLFSKSFSASFDEEVERCSKMALKLCRHYNNAVETMAKIRRNGKQKMVIEHVHIEDGAQAMVGNIDQGGKQG